MLCVHLGYFREKKTHRALIDRARVIWKIVRRCPCDAVYWTLLIKVQFSPGHVLGLHITYFFSSCHLFMSRQNVEKGKAARKNCVICNCRVLDEGENSFLLLESIRYFNHVSLNYFSSELAHTSRCFPREQTTLIFFFFLFQVFFNLRKNFLTAFFLLILVFLNNSMCFPVIFSRFSHLSFVRGAVKFFSNIFHFSPFRIFFALDSHNTEPTQTQSVIM